MYTVFMYTLVFGYGCVQIHRSAMPKKNLNDIQENNAPTMSDEFQCF